LGAVQHSVGVGSRGCRGNGASGSATQTWHPAAAPGRRRGKPRPPGFFPASCAPPSLSYFFTPSIFGGGDGFGLGSSSPRGRRRNREACWGWSLIGGRLGFGGLEMDDRWRFREACQASRDTSTTSGSHGASASSRPPPCLHRGDVTGRKTEGKRDGEKKKG
jgi:hypothetical protein